MIDAGDSAMLRYRLPANFTDKILYISEILVSCDSEINQLLNFYWLRGGSVLGIKTGIKKTKKKT